MLHATAPNIIITIFPLNTNPSKEPNIIPQYNDNIIEMFLREILYNPIYNIIPKINKIN